MQQLPLVGLLEICQYAGVQRPVVSMWRTRHRTFPQPVADLHIGPIFWLPMVTTWLTNTGRPVDQRWTLEQVRTAKPLPGNSIH